MTLLQIGLLRHQQRERELQRIFCGRLWSEKIYRLLNCARNAFNIRNERQTIYFILSIFLRYFCSKCSTRDNMWVQFRGVQKGGKEMCLECWVLFNGLNVVRSGNSRRCVYLRLTIFTFCQFFLLSLFQHPSKHELSPPYFAEMLSPPPPLLSSVTWKKRFCLLVCFSHCSFRGKLCNKSH